MAIYHLSKLKEHIPNPHSHITQSFIIEDILTSSGYFSLERPIVARRLRLVINSGTADTFGRLCWEIEMFGCSFNKGM